MTEPLVHDLQLLLAAKTKRIADLEALLCERPGASLKRIAALEAEIVMLKDKLEDCGIHADRIKELLDA